MRSAAAVMAGVFRGLLPPSQQPAVNILEDPATQYARVLMVPNNCALKGFGRHAPQDLNHCVYRDFHGIGSRCSLGVGLGAQPIAQAYLTHFCSGVQPG